MKDDYTPETWIDEYHLGKDLLIEAQAAVVEAMGALEVVGLSSSAELLLGTRRKPSRRCNRPPAWQSLLR